MLRLTGAVLLLTASAAMGFGAAGALRQHERVLERIIRALEGMERELAGHLSPLPDLLERAAEESDDEVRTFFQLCWNSLNRREQQPFGKLWGLALEAAQLPLEEDELDLLADLGDVLGRYEAARQGRALRETAQRLEEKLARARERTGRMGKVYGTLGVTAGAFLVIVLL